MKTPSAWKWVSVLSAGVLLLSSLAAAPAAAQSGGVTAGSSKIGPQFGGPGLAGFVITKGRLSAAGTGMRGTGAGTITISGIPSPVKIKKAYLYWAVVDNATPSPGTNTGFVDDIPVIGTPIGSGPSPCWTPPSTHAYRADVKSIVKGRGDPNGPYALTGFPDSGNFDVAPSIEGAGLIIIWKPLQRPEFNDLPKRVIVVNDGLFVTNALGDLVTTTFVGAEGRRGFRGFLVKAPVSADLTVLGGDGQGFVDFTRFNSTQVGTNTWDASDGAMWDTDKFDVSSLIAAGDTSATASIGIPADGGDCIAWTTAILEVTGKKTRPGAN